MSGVASIGSRVKLQAPATSNARVSSSMSQRCRIENRMMRSSMRATSVFVLGAGLADVGLDQEALHDDDLLARFHAREDLHALRIAPAEFHHARRIGVAFAHVDDVVGV